MTEHITMTRQNNTATFVISLDFELFWGVRDVATLETYGRNVLGARSVVPVLLKLFQDYRIHATWAIVGFMFCETRDEILAVMPRKTPCYLNPSLSPYPYLKNIGHDEQDDPYHYAPSLIRLIASAPHQEIGSHTFSHYYCLERGQDRETFRQDLHSAIRMAAKYGRNIESLVFPRNQCNREYLSVCREAGIKAYRGNEHAWMYRAKNQEDESLFRRGVRLLDAYLNLSGHNCSSQKETANGFPLNIPSSRFLRPFSKRFRIFEPLRLRRICSDMTYAAQNGSTYHLWWHPHNFGVHTDENLSFLKNILAHYVRMKEAYGMESLNMGELSRRYLNENGTLRPQTGEKPLASFSSVEKSRAAQSK